MKTLVNDFEPGKVLLSDDLNKLVAAANANTNAVEANAAAVAKLDNPAAGDTNTRKAVVEKKQGQFFFDTEMHKPCWWDAGLNQWVDATGADVDAVAAKA